MPAPLQLKSKICLVGEAAVGKTSLIRRFVLDQFDDSYIRTLGAKVSKKSMRVDVSDKVTVDITMAIWDVIGHSGFRQLLGDAFFDGAQGILAVADLTRRETLTVLPNWVQAVEGVSGLIPIVLAANKIDLRSEVQYGQPEVSQMATVLGCGSIMTSAKTGQHVEDAFLHLGKLIAEAQLGNRRAAAAGVKDSSGS